MATKPKSFDELYDEFYKAITENPDTPQIMHDEELARKFAERLKTMNPKAFIICVKNGLQYLTITDEARLVVAELLNADALHAAERSRELDKLAEKAAGINERRGDPFRAYLGAVAATLDAEAEDITADHAEQYAVAEKKRLLTAIWEAYDTLTEEEGGV